MTSRTAPKIRGAELAIKQLQRALRVRRLYFVDHPNVAQSIQQAHETLTRFVAAHGSLEVELSSRGVFFGGVRVVMESAQSSDLGRLLSAEGVQILAFEKGVTLEELAGFVEALATAPTGEFEEEEAVFGDDLLSSLWRLDFRNIHYKVLDLLSPACLDESLQDEALGAVANRIRVLSEELVGPDLTASSQDFLAELDALREAGELDDVVDWETQEALARDPDQVAPERAKLLRGVLEHDALLDRAVECLTWTCVEEGELEDSSELTAQCFPTQIDVVRFFAGASSHMLVQGNLAAACSLVERTQLLDGGDRQVAAPVRAELGSKRGMKRFLRALERNASSLDDAVTGDYLRRLGDAPIAALCEAYPTLNDEAARSLVDSYLAGHASSHPEPISTLTEHRDPSVVQVGVTLLSSAGVGTRAFDLLRAASADVDHPVRAGLALSAIDELTGERERRDLLATISEGETPEDRLRALARLLEIKAPSSFDPLAEILRSHRFVERDSHERTQLLAALVEIGGVRAVGLLEELQGRKTWFFRRGRVGKLRREAREELKRLKVQRA